MARGVDCNETRRGELKKHLGPNRPPAVSDIPCLPPHNTHPCPLSPTYFQIATRACDYPSHHHTTRHHTLPPHSPHTRLLPLPRHPRTPVRCRSSPSPSRPLLSRSHFAQFGQVSSPSNPRHHLNISLLRLPSSRRILTGQTQSHTHKQLLYKAARYGRRTGLLSRSIGIVASIT